MIRDDGSWSPAFGWGRLNYGNSQWVPDNISLHTIPFSASIILELTTKSAAHNLQHALHPLKGLGRDWWWRLRFENHRPPVHFKARNIISIQIPRDDIHTNKSGLRYIARASEQHSGDCETKRQVQAILVSRPPNAPPEWLRFDLVSISKTSSHGTRWILAYGSLVSKSLLCIIWICSGICCFK